MRRLQRAENSVAFSNGRSRCIRGLESDSGHRPVPRPAVMVPEGGHSQRPGPGVLNMDVSCSLMSDEHCKLRGTTDPSLPLPPPAHTLPPLPPTQALLEPGS